MAGGVTDLANISNFPLKHQRLFQKKIERNQPEAASQKLRGPCPTPWIQRHKVYEVFMELYPSAVATLDVMLYEHEKVEVYSPVVVG